MGLFSLQASSDNMFITREPNAKPGNWAVLAIGANAGSPSPNGQFGTIQGVNFAAKHQYVVLYGNSPQFALTVPQVNGKPGGILEWQPLEPGAISQQFTFLASGGTPPVANRVRVFSCYAQDVLAPAGANTIGTTSVTGAPAQDWYLRLNPQGAPSLTFTASAGMYSGTRIIFQASGLSSNTQYNFRFIGYPTQPLDTGWIFTQSNPGTTIQPESDAKGHLSATIDTPLNQDPVAADHLANTIVFLEDVKYNVVAMVTIPNSVFFYGH